MYDHFLKSNISGSLGTPSILYIYIYVSPLWEIDRACRWGCQMKISGCSGAVPIFFTPRRRSCLNLAGELMYYKYYKWTASRNRRQDSWEMCRCGKKYQNDIHICVFDQLLLLLHTFKGPVALLCTYLLGFSHHPCLPT